ncbi:28997_t:CDS:2, partial [Racocetra persica]
MSLSPPSTGNFESREALINHCDRGSHYINRLNLTDETHQKATSTRLIDCPFELYGKKMKDGQWRLVIKNERHNHEASQDISGHPSSHRLNEKHQQRVREMFTAGVRPREIFFTLCQDDPDKLAILKTIYNARDKIRRDNLQGHIPIQALLDELVEGKFEHNYQCDQNDNLTHLFFVHSKSITLIKIYNFVLLMDCTYKTNKFKMPLLHIVGITSFNTTFSSCFVFLKSEQEDDYVWALNRVAHIFGNVPKPKVIVTDHELALMHAIHTVFSKSQNVLCVWHIEKNVLTSYQQRPSEIKDVLQQSTLSAHQRSAIISKMPNLFQESTTVVQNPQVRQTRERPVGARNHAQSSTERDPSAFELVESERKCRIYHESRHNSRTCPNAESTSED